MTKSNELDNILKELDELGVLMDNEYGEEDEAYLLDEEDEDKEDENEEDEDEEDEDEEDEDEDKDGTYGKRIRQISDIVKGFAVLSMMKI